MKYFVSWTHSDPIYQRSFDDVRILVSPPNVSQAWQVGRWPSAPAELIIDSGAFQYHRAGRSPSPEAVLSQQLHIAAGFGFSLGICHLDILTAGVRDPVEAVRHSAQNLSQARWLIERGSADLPENAEPIGVIQGRDAEQIFYVAQALAEMGYRRFALGSLAGKVASSRDEVLRRTEAALEAVGPRLHMLGVSSVPVLEALAHLGVESADSGAPIKEAARGGIFYSEPFRRYKLPSAHFREWQRSYSFAAVIESPLPCACPVCQDDPTQIMNPNGKAAINLRALHNYYHLRRDIEGPQAR
ncbi:MAG: hypothetical protein HGA45_28535 [Chloroflexales bacterium]|nr:hypothetical protein [Chloroflexales bacterium]